MQHIMGTFTMHITVVLELDSSCSMITLLAQDCIKELLYM